MANGQRGPSSCNVPYAYIVGSSLYHKLLQAIYLLVLGVVLYL